MSHHFVLRIFMGSALLVGSTLGIVSSPSTQAAEPATVETSVARAAGPDCGDRLYRKPGGGYWRCSFADDFDGARLNRNKWTVVTTADSGYQSGTDACFVDDPANIFVANGRLNLRTLTVSSFACEHVAGLDYPTTYTSGSVTTGDKFQQVYGRYEFRVKFPAAKRIGLHSAVWLYPNRAYYGTWPASGEIDIAERFTAYENRLIPYVHYLRDGDEYHDTNEDCHVARLSDRFHKLVLIWTAKGMTIKYDGHRCLRVRTAADLGSNKPFDKPFSVLLTEALGVGHNQFRPGHTPLPATMQVDYVRVWR